MGIPLANGNAVKEDVPVIDASGLLCREGTAEWPPLSIVKQIRGACTRWGFFQLINHGLPLDLLHSLDEESKRFFALPLEKKLACKRGADNAWGFFNDELTKQKLDLKEGFDVGHSPRPDLPDDAPENRTLDGVNRWPPDEPEFRAFIEGYMRQVEGLAFALTRAFAAGLGLDPYALDSMFQPHHSAFLRLNYYPPHADRQGPLAAPVARESAESARESAESGESGKVELGIHPHTDAGFLTVLLQGMVPGLQVLDTTTGQWTTVEPIKDALVINVGAMAQVLSNDIYKAPLHRVLASHSVPRYSAPYFLSPKYEAICSPLPACVDAKRPAAYRPIIWGDFRSKRFAGDYADLGEEVQIEHYRLDSEAAENHPEP